MADGTLDPMTVQGLHELGQLSVDGADRIRHLVQTYIDDARTRLRGLADAVAANDAAEVRSLAHSLAGSSASLGAHVVATRSREIEALARSGDLHDARAAVEGLQAALSDAIVALRLEFGLGEVDDHSR
ncbi:MAG: Hpt domain-containing protein [Actinobacteria bacterium]|nr:Hpt domain-containing protein [Actinomycetota bacterium]